MLDRVGSKYPCRDHSFILGNRMLRSVNLSSSFDKLIFFNLLPLVTWLVPVGARTFVPGQFSGSADAVWGNIMFLISYVASMIVNTLVTGLIVFKILKVSLKVKPTSVERTLGSTGGTKFRHIIFVIIESGMALFATQLVRVTLVGLPTTIDLVIGINQMFNVIILRPVSFLLLLFFTNNIYLARESHQL